jgi:hypothetical protein
MNIVQIAVNGDSNCFGGYNTSDPLCVKHCVLRLRCAIEQDQNIRTEIIEELIDSDNELGKMQ